MNQIEIDRLQHEWIISKMEGKCLHVGCGQRHIDGAVNIDPNPDREPWVDLALNVQDLWEFEDQSFDSVISNHVLQAVRDPVRAFAEMTRVLKIGGTMAHIIPDHRHAPIKRDLRHPWQYMHNIWMGPEHFQRDMIDVLHNMGLVALHIWPFEEFQWSFKVWLQRCWLQDAISRREEE